MPKLTHEQEVLKCIALQGAPADRFPFITNDPVVNHAVDQYLHDYSIPYNEDFYKEEISAWLAEGKLLLGWVTK